MTDALKRPAPRNPILPLRLPTLPPAARSRASLRMTASVAEGRFELQACHDCGQVQYPPRDACTQLSFGAARHGNRSADAAI